MTELPTGTVTFLFTDLEGSTRLWEQHPDAMKEALARHDEILRDAIVAHDGHVVKMTGDGVHAAFATARGAIATSLYAQRAFADVESPEPGTLRVRMGVHTGAAETRDGDYYGTAVNKAARLMSIAHGGQVVVSLTTEELLRDDMLDGCSLLDLGEHTLRDLAQPERVFQLEHAELQRDFPALRSVDAYRGNLPLQTTSFIGRESELAELSRSIRDARLVTITGVGGVGKTRLAIQVAAELLPAFPDGAWLCELAAASDSDSMAQVVASALGVQPRAGVSLERGILDFLRTKQLLLVLDNCEHLVDAAASIAEGVMRECPSVCLLATSREGLAVAGEQVWPLRSLAADQAAELFGERAHSVAPTAAIDPHDDAVSEICRRLDGIPLAIELAAARAVALGSDEIASRLDERFRLLTGGRRTAVERHQTLRATVDWSYSMLDSRDQLVFARLGVFSGTFGVAAAETVAARDGIDAWDVVDALTDLAAKSMIVTETSAGGTRYRLLETMRAYAREQLERKPDIDHWRRRHAMHYASAAETFGPALRGPDELECRERLVADLDNLRAAVTWALDRGTDSDADLAARIIAALTIEAHVNGVVGIGAWADRAAREELSASGPSTRAAVWSTAAWEAVDRGDFVRAEELAQRALEHDTGAGYLAMHMAYVSLGCVHGFSDRAPEALRLMEQALGEAHASNGGYWLESHDHGVAAFFASSVGAFALGREHAELALASARASASPSAIAMATAQFGYSQWRDDPERALAALVESIELTRARAKNAMFGPALSLSARLEARKGDARAALEHLREAVVDSDEAGDATTLFSTYDRCIRAFTDLGNPQLAALLVGVVTVGPFANLTTIGYGAEAEDRERMLVRARTALGDEAYGDAVARGAQMTYEEVVDHVLGEIDRMVAELPS